MLWVSQLPLVAVLAITYVSILWRLGEPALIQPDEGRSAEIAREVNLSGAWLIPTLNGFPHLDKPVLYFKLVGVALRTMSDPEAAARLPSALFAIALVGLVVVFYRSAYRQP